MTDIDMLVRAISVAGKSKESVASAANMDRATFYRKLQKNGESFTIEQVRKMAAFIPLSEKAVRDIFLL